MVSAKSTPVEPAHKGILRDETVVLRWIFGYCRNAQLINGMSWPDIPQTSVPRGFNSDVKDLGFLSIDVDHFRVENGVIQRVEVARPIKITDLGTWLKGFTRKPYVLVVHGGKQELSLLSLLNIKLEPVFIIDTVKAAQFPLQLWYRNNLKELLDEFEVPYSHLHIAGNDAHLTLRVFLMIAVRDAEIHLEGKNLPDWIPILKAVAQSPLPPRPPTRREVAAIAEAEAERHTTIEAKEA
ncbi:uncharacterized protein FTOL_11693 [Fusarium torulosum]|uniref:Gfd2/YDR514C-like C-terminal domain-containing protein n=1 Tax=Fusarium torulosum TaxID=33205 RepID=A0AAE8MKU8_9HYPO|nr:uncharacterized protein FTOL_11693 [Fusarium torulosum]